MVSVLSSPPKKLIEDFLNNVVRLLKYFTTDIHDMVLYLPRKRYININTYNIQSCRIVAITECEQFPIIYFT